VRGVRRRSTSAGSRPSVASSMSANTGRAPTRSTALAVDTNVNEGQITSSPSPTPSASSASSIACVHDVVSSTRFTCSRAWRRVSTLRQNGPSPLSLPCKAWPTRSRSRASIAGTHKATGSTGAMVASPARMAAASRLLARLFPSAPYLAHLGVVLVLFAPILFEGRMLFHRDVSSEYYPDYVFLERSLAQGLWPLWNPTSDGGAPFFMPYPVTVLIVGVFGARKALALSPALHVLLAMGGATLLSRARGRGPWGAW